MRQACNPLPPGAESMSSSPTTAEAAITNKSIPGSRLITLTCYASFLGLGIASTLLGPTFQSLTHRFSIPLQNGGLFTLVSFGGATLSTPFYGRILDRVNVRYILCAGPLLMGSSLLLLSVAPTLAVALLATLLLGFGAGALVIAPNVVIATLNPANAGSALNFLNVFYGIGAITGPQIVSFALAQNNFVLAFRIAAIFLLLLIIPFSRVSLHVRGDDRKRSRPSIYWTALIPLAMLYFIYVGTESGFGSWIFTQLTKVSLSTEATAAIGTSIFWAGLTGGRLLASLVPHRLTDTQVLIVCLVTLAVGMALLLGFPKPESLSVLSAFLVGLGCGPLSPTIMAIATNRYPDSRGTVLGAVQAFGSIGGAILPWVQGQVGGGTSGGMIVPLIMAFVMLGIVIVTRVQDRRAEHVPV